MSQLRKGFTLIELLIVVGILAVLATITVLVLNPAELFRQARDSQRLSDLGSLKGAVSLYLTTVTTPDLAFGAFTCGTDWGSDKVGVANKPASVAATNGSPSNAAAFGVDGTGWVTVKLDAMSGGSPLPVLPRDPNTSDATKFYTYSCGGLSNLKFELTAKMESGRYIHTPLGSDDVEGTDGGNDLDRYETGTQLTGI